MANRNLPNHGRSNQNDETLWSCVATAPDQLVAEMWLELLHAELIPAMLAPGDAVSFMGLASTPVRLMVPATMRERAEELLASIEGTEGTEGTY